MISFPGNQYRIQSTKLFAILFSLLLLFGCSAPEQNYLVYVGTYTGSGSEGIYAYRFNAANGELKPVGLIAKTENPSFFTIAPNGKFLYAVNELDSFQHESTGAVSVFSINRETGKLELLQQVSSLGAAPCYVSLDKTARYLLVANYNGGNAAVFHIGNDAKLGEKSAFIQDAGSSVNLERQTAPHAHFIQVTNDNRFAMIADLGIDQVLVYKFAANAGTLTSIDSGFVKLNPGSGPRHLAFTPSGKFVYVLNELSSTVTAFSFDSKTGRMQTQQTIYALPENFSGINTAAEIAVDAKGKFLYVSNRGNDSIGIFSMDGDDGRLTSLGWISSGGKTPRHFEIDPTGQWLLVANQNSNNLVIFRIDLVNGKLEQTMELSDIHSPVCVRFLPNR